MSVVNSMLRDLEARSGDLRQPKIPVRTAPSTRRSGALLIGTAIVAVAAVAWQYLAPLREDSLPPAAPQTAPAAAAAPLVVPQAAETHSVVPQPALSPVTAVQPVSTVAVSEPAPTTLHASWHWSSDSFALQLDAATDVRYGIERVAADTLKISLAHAALAAVEIPSPTPSWIDSARVQRDAEQQTITINADARLEYDVAMLNGGALVISVWRDENSTADVNRAASDMSTQAATPVVENEVPDETASASTPIKTRASAPIAAPHDYAKPRIDPSALTPAQRDTRQSAQAATQLRAGQNSQALSTLRVALESGDAAPKSAALLVTVLMSQQHLQEAQPYLDRALQQTPRDATLLKLKARMLAAQGEIARARDVLSALAPATSTDTELLALTASLAQQAHDFAAAASYYLQWTRAEPANGAAWYGLALALDAQASSQSAIAAYQHALTLINDARLRDYAGVRIVALQGKADVSATTGAAAAR